MDLVSLEQSAWKWLRHEHAADCGARLAKGSGRLRCCLSQILTVWNQLIRVLPLHVFIEVLACWD